MRAAAERTLRVAEAEAAEAEAQALRTKVPPLLNMRPCSLLLFPKVLLLCVCWRAVAMITAIYPLTHPYDAAAG